MYRTNYIKILTVLLLLPTLVWARDYTQYPPQWGGAVYLFNEGSGTTTADNSGNGNTATFASSGHPAWSTNAPGFLLSGSAAFSVSSDATSEINTNASNILQYGSALTICLWFYQTSNPAYSPTRFFDVNGSAVIGTNLATTSSNDLAVRLAGSTNLVRDSVNNVFSLNTWTLVFFTMDMSTTASNYHIYTATLASPTVTEVTYQTTTNGVSLTSITGSNLVILNRDSDKARAFIGNVANVGIFNGIMSQIDMQNIANYGLRGLNQSINNAVIRNASIS